jgi:hypothetical protein
MIANQYQAVVVVGVIAEAEAVAIVVEEAFHLIG